MRLEPCLVGMETQQDSLHRPQDAFAQGPGPYMEIPAQRDGTQRSALLVAAVFRNPRAFGTLAFAALTLGVVLLTLGMYRNRHRYDAMAMVEFYDWSRELRAGGNPWLPSLDPAFKAIAHMQHRGQCNYPPAFLIAFAAFTFLPLQSAFWVWQALLVGSLFASVALVVYELEPPSGLAPYALAVGATLLFPEVYGSLYESEPTLLLLALIVAAFVFDRRGKPASAGFLLALAALFKLFPALVGGYFLVRRRWVTLVWAIVFGLAGLILTSSGSARDFLRFGVMHSNWLINDQWLRNTRSIAIYPNLRALLDLLYGGSLPVSGIRLWLALTALADTLVVAITAMISYRASITSDVDVPSIGLWLCAMILVSPIAWGHYLPFIIPMIIGLATCALRGERVPLLGGILIGAGLLGIYAAYFSGALRDLHLFFFSASVIYSGGAITIWHWSTGRSRPGPPEASGLCATRS